MTMQNESHSAEGRILPTIDQIAAEEARKAQHLLECEQCAVDLSEEYIEPTPIIELEGCVVASVGNISAVVGEAKSKKTFLCSAIIGDLMRFKQPSRFGFTRRLGQVLWIDTEQSKLHARKLYERLIKLTNPPSETEHPLIKMLTLREKSPLERRTIVIRAIESYHPRLVVIDGISDLQHNTNDLEESEEVVTQLMALSTIHNCHILCVLHTNPGSDKARGHTGSALQRKAESVLYVRKVGDASIVEPQFCRNEPFERFAFKINDDGLPESCDLPSDAMQSTPEGNDVVRVMRDHFPDGVSRTTLITKLVELYGWSRNQARVRIHRTIRKDLLEPNGDDLFLR